ncbi:MAG: hypothetical protein K2P52_09305 [Campylobacterales bacterium]|nr:hypothetical protein [Campylobacterales bacterium]
MNKDELVKIYTYVMNLHKEHRDISQRLDTIFITISAASLPAILTISTTINNLKNDIKSFLFYASIFSVLVIITVFLKLALERYKTDKIAKDYYDLYKNLSNSRDSDLNTYQKILEEKNNAANNFKNDGEKLFSLQSLIYLFFTSLIVCFEIAIYKI